MFFGKKEVIKKKGIGKSLIFKSFKFGKKEATPKNRNWKISDFLKSFKFGKKEGLQKTGIEKSLIFKSPNLGRRKKTAFWFSKHQILILAPNIILQKCQKIKPLNVL
jgi:hypothetical protein